MPDPAAFRVAAENNRVVLTLGPAMAETLSLYLEREGFEDEARAVWGAMEEVCEQQWPAESQVEGG